MSRPSHFYFFFCLFCLTLLSFLSSSGAHENTAAPRNAGRRGSKGRKKSKCKRSHSDDSFTFCPALTQHTHVI